MPLTPAHAAAALPLRAAARRLGVALPLSALVVGTVSPDFEYLLRLSPHGHFAHSPLGLVAFCLPVGLATWIAFRALVAPALLRLLPPGLAAALQPARTGLRRSLLPATAAVLLGALSHQVWDGFTHDYGWAAIRLPILHAPVSPALGHISWYKLLQHASTVVGLTVLLVAAARWLLRQPRAARRFGPGQAARSCALAAALLVVATVAAAANAIRDLDHGLTRALGLAATGGMAGLVAGLLAYGLLARRRRADEP